MSADTLREVAAQIRRDWPEAAFCQDACRHHPYSLFHRAVADWLDREADATVHLENVLGRIVATRPDPQPEALAVAAAYLGRPA